MGWATATASAGAATGAAGTSGFQLKLLLWPAPDTDFHSSAPAARSSTYALCSSLIVVVTIAFLFASRTSTFRPTVRSPQQSCLLMRSKPSMSVSALRSTVMDFSAESEPTV